MPATPLHLPLRASRVHVSHHHCSLYLVPPLKKKCKSFVPFTSNFPLVQTPRCLTKKNLAPQGHLDKFFFFFLLFPSHLEPVQDNSAHNITAISSPCTHEGHPCSLTTTSLAACKQICHHTALSPTQLTDPVVPNLGFTATPTTLPPPRHSCPSPPQPAPPQSCHHATLCRHASHPVAPTLTRIAGTHWPCCPPTKMSFFPFFSFFPFIKLFQDNSYHINVTPISLAQTPAAPSPLQPRQLPPQPLPPRRPTPDPTTTITTSTPLHTNSIAPAPPPPTLALLPPCSTWAPSLLY